MSKFHGIPLSSRFLAKAAVMPLSASTQPRRHIHDHAGGQIKNDRSRASALDRLVRAQGFLPDGYPLQVKEAWRPIWAQERLWEISLGRLRDGRPDLTDEELHTENARFTAPPDSAPPHREALSGYRPSEPVQLLKICG
jgi:hypothetical protein